MLSTKELTHKSYSAKVAFTQACKQELQWWTKHLETWNGRAIISVGPDIVPYTDAGKKVGSTPRRLPSVAGVNLSLVADTLDD